MIVTMRKRKNSRENGCNELFVSFNSYCSEVLVNFSLIFNICKMQPIYNKI